MALIQANFVSKSLLRTVPIQVILPVDKFSMSRSGHASANGKSRRHAAARGNFDRFCSRGGRVFDDQQLLSDVH